MTGLHRRTNGVRHASESMLLVQRQVLDEISAYARNVSPTLEAGGLLLGYRRYQHIHVMTATFPGKTDECRPHLFGRRDPSHQDIATFEWKHSGRKMDWVGEWHSHLEPVPSPSTVDAKSWANQVFRRQANMAYVIVGTEGCWIGLLDSKASAAIQLKEIEATDRTVLFGSAT